MILVFACGVLPLVSLATVEQVTNRDQALFVYMSFYLRLIFLNFIISFTAIAVDYRST